MWTEIPLYRTSGNSFRWTRLAPVFLTSIGGWEYHSFVMGGITSGNPENLINYIATIPKKA
jgi:hypothetical protein